MKNAMSMLLTAQGTPLLFAGDEFGNSQNGNNNCYCQDNETGWVDWRELSRNQEYYTYVRELIAFRKHHSILHLRDNLTTLDRYGHGYPDLSYHSEEAWKVQVENYSRHIGIMYCGQNEEGEGDYIYIACNMHWNSHRFALPSIANHKWISVLSPETCSVVFDEDKNMEYIDIAPRSITILTGRKLTKAEIRQKAAMQTQIKNMTNLSEKNVADRKNKRSQKR